MKITDVRAYVVVPNLSGGSPGKSEDAGLAEWQWTFVVVDTDEGISGWGESSNVPRNTSLLTGAGVNAIREALIGEDPADIERLWHKVYRRYTYLGSRGFPTTVLSGVDIALWDIKGKTLGRPVYDLLGGKFRDTIRTYANGWFGGCDSPAKYAAAARKVVKEGHDAVKLDPFLEMNPFHTMYQTGQISAAGEQQGYDIVAAIREAVGPHVEILIDAHGHYNVPTAIRIGNNLFEQSKIGWYEEPVPPEGVDAIRQVREHCAAPICVGERLFTRYDFLPLFQNRITDYIMPDVTWTGGISELKKISTMAEAYYIPVSPHNAQGPGQILAGAHTMMTIPNFYRLEHAIAFKPAYDHYLQTPLGWKGNYLKLSDRPGLGVDLDMDAVMADLHPAWKGQVSEPKKATRRARR
ncbi:MAG: mandelate racemase/muconate lactonizing enzyme family protein [Dehalococcoidia bacterium]|nr:mandelate racemase/muconate lactonizing enzyme family protein [Dehalococcoidia bacterium]MSQ34393.1 mandelate racemase/muconate lactonizing enzyme family protein [Dehalococcoidia bacterium]